MPTVHKASKVGKKPSGRVSEFLLVDISNSFVKIAFSSRSRIGRIERLPTPQFTRKALQDLLGSRSARQMILASVVPKKTHVVRQAWSGALCEVSHQIPLGIGISYPHPETIGADRLANAVAAASLYGSPALVVDFGTAVTFDVISPEAYYMGGVIAPGLNAMTEYLHSHTALLPRVTLREPPRAIGRSTREAMLSGAVHGYRGLIGEIVRQITREMPGRKKPLLIATGGDARIIAGRTGLFSAVSPRLTLEGLRLIGCRNFPGSELIR